MLALGAVWRAVHEPLRRGRWLVAASLVYGLAVGARPDLLFGAVILLVPVAQAWREPGESGRAASGSGVLLAASVAPHVHRFGIDALQSAALRKSVRIGAALSAGGKTGKIWCSTSACATSGSIFASISSAGDWSRGFPFVQQNVAAVQPLPAGHAKAEGPFRGPGQRSARVAGAGCAAGLARTTGGNARVPALVSGGGGSPFWNLCADHRPFLRRVHRYVVEFMPAGVRQKSSKMASVSLFLLP